MASTPLDKVREELSSTPREREYLDLGDSSGWSQQDKQDVVGELLDAANKGDARVPAALWGLMPREWLRKTFEQLLGGAFPRVATEAGYQLAELDRQAISQAVTPALTDGTVERHSLLRAADLLLSIGAVSQVQQLLRDTRSEEARGVLVERLWKYKGFNNFPTVWWAGFGLLERRLGIPIASFRVPAVAEFLDVVDAGSPIYKGYQPMSMAGGIPPALKAAMDDVQKGVGPVRDDLLNALGNDLKEGFLVYAADCAATRTLPRGIPYVARLAGDAHRDLYEWAANHPSAAMARAGRDALSMP